MALDSGDVVRVSVRFALGAGQDHINVYHFTTAGGVSDSDEDIVNAFANHFDALYAWIDGWLDPAMVGVDVKVDVVEWNVDKWEITRNVGLTSLPNTFFTPGGTGDPLPHTDAAVINMITGWGKSIGRKYFSGFTEAAQDDGSLVAGAVSSFGSMLSAFLTPMVVSAGNTLAPVVASTVDGAVRAITETIVSTYLGRQGRRRQDIGS